MAKRQSTRNLRPQLFSLEERAVPASYYVDNAFIGKSDGTVVTFNQGQPNQVPGLVIGTDAFATFGQAITKANGDTAADSVNIANGTYTIDQAANGGAFLVTNPLDFVGSGTGVTLLVSISDTVDSGGTNGALFAAQNTTFGVRDLTLDGNGDEIIPILTVSAFRFEASNGIVDNVVINNVSDLSSIPPVSLGYAIVVTGAGSDVTVSDSSFANNGRGAVRFDQDASGAVLNSTLTGRSGILATSLNYGVDITNGSTALVSGNKISGFLGSFVDPVLGLLSSAGIEVGSNPGEPASSATILGNTIDGNFTGIIVGLGGTDASTINAQFNNISNNTVVPGDPDSGISTDTTGSVVALNNFWGTAAGPLAIDNPTGNPASGVSPDVQYKSASITQPPNGIALATLPTVTSDSVANAKIAASPSITVTRTGTLVNPVTLSIVFTEAVTGFDKTDIALGGTAGAATVATLTTLDNITFTATVTGVTQTGNLTVNIAEGVAVENAGLGNNANATNIPIAAVAPSVTITRVGTANSPVTLSIAFSDVVTGFDKTDVVVGGTAGAATVSSLTTSDNKTFTATVTGVNQTGNLSVNIAAGVAIGQSSGLGNSAGSANIPITIALSAGYAVSGDAGIVTPAFLVNPAGGTSFGKSPFGPNFTGGNRVASADLNGDGTLDLIVGSGGGISTQVLAFDGITGNQVFNIIPFGANFIRGAYVSGGDLTGDGRAEIAITAERGGGARIRIFSPNAAGVFTQLSDFIGIIGSTGVPDLAFRGGARSAIGDFNGDGRNDLAFAAGTGGGPRIALFNGLTLGLNGGPKMTGDFFVFEPTLRDGSNVAAGDVNGDGKADLIVGAGNGASRVRVINGNTLIVSNGLTVTAIADYFAYGTTGGTGVRVAADDLDGDGKADVITGPGTGQGSTVKVYSATNLLANPNNPSISQQQNFFGSFQGGLYVG